jgi:hypothetical protein
MKERREPHPTIPHLYREPRPRSAAETIYPYLKSQSQRSEQNLKDKRETQRALLPDATRGGMSPLGGKAK